MKPVLYSCVILLFSAAAVQCALTKPSKGDAATVTVEDLKREAIKEFHLADADENQLLDEDEFVDYYLNAHKPQQVPKQVIQQVWVWWSSFINAFIMIVATELGDKTFFIAAIMAMNYARGPVLAGALVALVVMTVLSTAIGFALPNLIPRSYTHYAAALLFVYFGVKLLYDSRTMGEGASEELAEVEEELGARSDDDADEADLESGRKARTRVVLTATAVAWQTFYLTFLGEWGDRSQIATIAMAAARDPIAVTLGGLLGHSACTVLAVVGGKLLASRISEKTVTIGGGVLFLLFAIHSFIFE